MDKMGVEQLKTFYLEAAGQCYSGSWPYEENKTTGEIAYWFDGRNGLLYLDRCQPVGEKGSRGTTDIYLHGRSVWTMQYQSQCWDDDPRITTFLKEALRQNYSAGIWNAGRGPAEFTDDRWPGLVYENIGLILGLRFSRAFDNFQSRDIINRLGDNPEARRLVLEYNVRGFLG